jgi:gliding motility-associated lipoprotein GldH
MTGKTINRILLLPIIVLLVVNCSQNKNIIFTDTATMPGATWRLADNPHFKVTISDTTLHTDLFFSIRTGSEYPFRNIWLFVSATSPDGTTTVTDTLQYDLADQKGDWYGRGFGDIHELKLPFRQNVFFPHRGTYDFMIQHGMRIGDLKGVYDFGFRIEKTGK